MAIPEPSPLTRELFSKGHESRSKYDYFVCSVAGAVFAYTAQHYSPKRFAWSFSMLEPLSLVLLAVCFFCGLRRLHYVALGTQINHTINDSDEKATQLGGIMADPHEKMKYKPEALESINRDMLKHYGHARSLEGSLVRTNYVAKAFHTWRDNLLIAGFAAIFFAKLLQPYEADSVPARDEIYRIMNVSPPPQRPQATQYSTPTQPAGTAKNQLTQPATSAPNQSTNSALQTKATSGQTNPPPKGTN